MRVSLTNDEGVAGLKVLLAIVVMLFTIGFIIMIYALLGAELFEEAQDENVGYTVINETFTIVNETGTNSTYFTYVGFDTFSVIACVNATGDGDGTAMNSANYTTDSDYGTISFTGNDLSYNNSDWNCTYTYQRTDNTTASDTIDATYQELSETTDWFSIIIVLGAMVVLILLTIIIISAIRGSGMLGGGTGGSAGTGGGDMKYRQDSA